MKSSNKQFGFVGYIFVVWLFLVVVCGLGWVMNAYKLTQLDFAEPYKAEIVRTIGVFVPPVGFIAGWFDIEDGKR